MTRVRWHVERADATLTVSRRHPVRWDVAVETVMDNADRLRIAHQIRQDMWRALQKLRGFSPAVAVTRADNSLQICAGGQIDGRCNTANVASRIAEVLDLPENRARWLRSAKSRDQIAIEVTEERGFSQTKGSVL